MSVKSLATMLVALAGTAAIGAAATAVGCLATAAPASAEAFPAVFFAPLPLDPALDPTLDPAPGPGPNPAAAVPSVDQLNGVLYGLADPAVPFANKTGLIEGGLGPIESHAADKKLQKAENKGVLPLSFDVANIQPAGPFAATADVTASGPQTAPQTMNVTFVDQDGWKISRASAMTLLQATSSH